MEPEIDDNFDVIAETDEFIVFSKSGNCPIHEGGLYSENCLTRLVEKRFGKRLYPVYRLDRETSGIVVFAKDRKLVKKIADSISGKEYIAIVKGRIDERKIIDVPIGEKAGDYIKWKKCASPDGKKAITEIIPIKMINDRTIVRVLPKTGRQHQIRVHLQHIGHPIMGDKIYGESDLLFKEYLSGKKIKERQLLHLQMISIGKLIFSTELPKDMIII